MRSSTSNSDIHLTRRFVPGGRWLLPLAAALALSLLIIGGLEAWLAARGFEATVVDSPSLWAEQRARADRLGDRALILVGSSRMQLDVDLPTLRDMTGKEPVQLAIDGSSFVPVLADLAADDKVSGTVIVDYQDHVMADLERKDGAALYVAEWERERGRDAILDFSRTEAWLSGFVHRHMRSFADGASPFASLTLRALDVDATPQYLVMLPDRERLADYRRVRMPDFYFSRVLRNAGISEATHASDWQDFNDQLTRQIEALAPVSMPRFAANSRVVAAMVRRIAARGGHVAFVMFPRSGLVRAADERLFPREDYWRPFINAVQAPSLHYADVPSMKALICPDGSHLDRRARVAFTRDLVHAMPLLSGGDAGNGRRPPRAMPPSPSPSEHGS